MLPAVRVFIDFLAENLPKQIESSRLDCGGKCDESSEGKDLPENQVKEGVVGRNANFMGKCRGSKGPLQQQV